ncbi:MAG: lysylphosphatidylglycerol synthase transmembrane domain-containing protein [Sulfuricaulis sp.]|nr:lysylphosphatidylglycerol synthase transmembrane domain-containing protein [Sulfuricaulis sp.]
MKAAAIRTARVAVAGGLTAYILWKSHPREVLTAAAGAEWQPLLVAVLLVLVDRVLMAYRWIVLLYTLDPADRPPLADILRIFFVSTFVGTFLPSVGGDAVRAYGIANLNVRGGDAVASVFMDRMLGIASLFLMALAGLTLARDLAGNWAIIASLGLAAAACLVTLLLVFSQRADVVMSMILTRLPAAVRHAGQRVLESIQRYAAHHSQLAKVLVCSVAVQALRILQAYYLGRGLGIEASLGTYFAFLPLILLVMLLPVTVSGLGTGQAAFLWFFARVGVSAAAAFALSVLFIGLGIVGNLPGGILYALGPRERSSAGL